MVEQSTREHKPLSGLDFIRRAVREIVTTILPTVLLALLVNVFVAEAALVEEGPSMQPICVAVVG